MNLTKKSLILSSLVVLISVLAVFSFVVAGSLTPPGSPAGTMHTLEDVYQNMPTSPVWSKESTAVDGLCSADQSQCGLAWNANNCNSDPSYPNCLCAKVDANNNCVLMLGATEYCAYLDATPDPATGELIVDTTPQNYWHLPTEGELLKALSKGFLENSDGGGFKGYSNYWSSTPYADVPGNAWDASYGVGNVYPFNGNMSTQYLVRCVH